MIKKKVSKDTAKISKVTLSCPTIKNIKIPISYSANKVAGITKTSISHFTNKIVGVMKTPIPHFVDKIVGIMKISISYSAGNTTGNLNTTAASYKIVNNSNIAALPGIKGTSNGKIKITMPTLKKNSENGKAKIITIPLKLYYINKKTS